MWFDNLKNWYAEGAMNRRCNESKVQMYNSGLGFYPANHWQKGIFNYEIIFEGEEKYTEWEFYNNKDCNYLDYLFFWTPFTIIFEPLYSFLSKYKFAIIWIFFLSLGDWISKGRHVFSFNQNKKRKTKDMSYSYLIFRKLS